MNPLITRLIAPMAALVCALSTAAAPAQGAGSVQVSDGPTPFIRFVSTRVGNVASFTFAQFQIQPKTGSATRPINVRYARSYLEARGYFDSNNGNVTIPVFGLYAGRPNSVTIDLGFSQKTKEFAITITTPFYDGGTYSNPTVIQPRLPGTTLSYDFILLKNAANPNAPIIIDTDAEIRWVGTAGVGAMASILFDNAFYVASGTSLLRIEFDGVTTPVADYSGIGVTNLAHHNIDPGREGMILDVNTVDQTESVNLEVDAGGKVLRTWNLANIISAAMIAGGDNPNLFVYPAPTDWFHNNACAYSSSDNSLIVSSRENFVIALDYDSGNIKWILGDPTKHWYQFLSLRHFAVTLAPGPLGPTLPPIGQHAVSMSGDQLLLHDNGLFSSFQQPQGETRTYSAPRKYQIHSTALPMSPFVDNFSGAGSVNLPAHTADTGQGWTDSTGQTIFTTLKVSGGAVYDTMNADIGVSTYTPPSPDQEATITVIKGAITGSPDVGIALRCFTSIVSPRNYVGRYVEGSGFEFVRTDPGAGNVIISPMTAGTLADGDTLRMTVSGTGAAVILTLYKNGISVATYTDTSANRIVTNGKVGIFLYNPGFASTGNFQITSITTPEVDLGAFTATEIWHYTPNPSVYSRICSSVYEDAPGNYVIDYAVPDNYTGIVGLDALGNVTFNYQYEQHGCGTSWNAKQIHWENLELK